jgi:tRNA (guanine-N7-)-methyltransferase
VATQHYISLLQQRRDALAARLGRIAPSAQVVLEIGCGHGHFLAAYAAAHPHHTCIGIDIASERIDRAERKRERAGLPNLYFLQAEAKLFLSVLPSELRLSAVFILFPDPWPKLRHNKHRLLQTDFLKALAAHCVPDCPLHFRTDFRPYFEAVREVIAADEHWRLDPSAVWLFEYATVFQERAERYDSLIARCKLPWTGAAAEAVNGKAS